MTYYLLHAGQPSARRLLKRVPILKPYVSSSNIGSGDVVIRYGGSPEADPHQGTVFNPQNAIQRTASRGAMARFLRRIGVRVWTKDRGQSEDARLLRQYRIPMFDLTPLTCFRCDGNQVWINQRIQRVQDSFREVPLDDDRVTVRAVRLASRVLHALGLDHGMVSIGMAQQGVLYVLDVTASPVLHGRMLDLYARAVEDFMAREDRVAETGTSAFLLGADVELMLRNPVGKMVLASNYFGRKGRVGCDDRSLQFDGQRLPLMELRPEPDASPLGLMANLRDTMMEATRKIDRAQVEWRAGSMPFKRYCTGGHIHFSSVPFSSRFVKVLDNYLGLPLMMVEDPRTARLRRPRYGFLGDVRHKDYGGFEYRTPGSFIVSPDITVAAFCLAYVVAVHHRELPIVDLYDERLQFAFFNGGHEILKPIVERNFEALSGLTAYERYKNYIDPLFEMIRQGQTWDESVDIRTLWGIPLHGQRKSSVRRVQRRAARARA
jgi:Phage phiEco32-like COOH.NH2 ligase-type 2